MGEAIDDSSLATLRKDLAKNTEYTKMLRGDLYYSFGPEMLAARKRSTLACKKFNGAEDESRRTQVQLFRNILGDNRPMPAPAATEEEDEALFADDPFVCPPVAFDYGIHVSIGPKTFIGFRFTCLDVCKVTIGARCLIGPNVSIFTASHPADPAERNGIDGPECGDEIHIGDDCWIGGNVTILAGVTIGRGATIGAASVVTKNVAPFTVVAGTPAKFIKHVKSPWNPDPAHQV